MRDRSGDGRGHGGPSPDPAAAHAAGTTPAPLALDRPEALTPEDLLGLQQTVGNSAVTALLARRQEVQTAEDSARTVRDVTASEGSPLEEPVREEMEARLGHDFSDVRVHTDTAADESARAMGARAYTSGSHLVFQEGAFDPGSTDGATTLAHELTHVVQQRSGPVAGTPTAGGLQLSDPDDHHEREAVAAADKAVSGRAGPQPADAAGGVPSTGSAGAPVAAESSQGAAGVSGPGSAARVAAAGSVGARAADAARGGDGGGGAGSAARVADAGAVGVPVAGGAARGADLSGAGQSAPAARESAPGVGPQSAVAGAGAGQAAHGAAGPAARESAPGAGGGGGRRGGAAAGGVPHAPASAAGVAHGAAPAGGARPGSAGPGQAAPAPAGPAARAAGGDPLGQWTSAVSAAAGGIAAPQLEPGAAAAALTGQAASLDAERQAARPDYAAQAQARVAPPPAEPERQATLDTHVPEDVVRGVREQGATRLRDQTFPGMTPMPAFGGGSHAPGPGGAAGPTAVPPQPMPTERPPGGPVEPGAVPADPRADRVSGEVAAATPPTAGAGAGQAVTLHDPGAASLEPPPAAQAEQIGAVVAEVRSHTAQYAQEFADAAKSRLDPRGSVSALTPLVDALKADQEQSITAELDGVVSAAGLAAGTLAGGVATHEATATQQAQSSAAALESASTAETARLQQAGAEQAALIDGARQAADAGVDQRARAAEGAPDEAAIERSRDGYLGAVDSALSAGAAAYQSAGRARESELDRVAQQQKTAYQQQARAAADRIRRDFVRDGRTEDEGRVEGRRALDWAARQAEQVDVTLDHLKRDNTAEVERLTTTLQGSRDGARERIREWAANQSGTQRSWWDRLLDGFRDWGEQAKTDTAAWQRQVDAQNRDAIAGDFALLTRLRDAQQTQGQAAVEAELARLSGEQRAIALAFLNSGGGNPITAVARLLVDRLKNTRTPEMARTLEERAIATLDWENLGLLGAAQTPGFNPRAVAHQINDSVRGMGTDRTRLFAALQGRTPIQIAAIRKAYPVVTNGSDLDEDLRGDLDDESEDTIAQAEALLAGDQVGGAVAALHGAVDGLGTDTEVIMQTLRGKSQLEREAIMRAYRERYGVDLQADLEGDLSGNEAGQAQALLTGDTEAADAYALAEAVQGLGTDEAALHATYDRIRAEVEARAAREGMSTAEVEAEIRRRNNLVAERYGTQTGGGAGALEADLRDDLEGGELNMALAEQAGDRTAMDAAAIQQEHESMYTDDDRVNSVLRRQHERAAAEVNRDTQVRIREVMRDPSLTPEQRTAAAERIRGEAEGEIEARAQRNMAALESRYDASSGGGTGSFDVLVAWELSGYAQEQARDLIAQGGRLTDAQELHYAVAGEGTDEEAIRRTLRGKSREEIARISADYQRLTGRPLLDDLEGDLGGRDWADTQAMLEGTSTPEEMAAYLRARREWELGDGTGVLGALFAGDEAQVLGDTADEAQGAYEEYRRLVGQFGADDPRTQAALDRFRRWAGYGDEEIDAHRAAVDSATDTAATVAATVVGIVVSVATAGTAAPAVVALYGALASGVATIAVHALGRGGAYGLEEFGADLGQALVGAGVAVATAGMGEAAIRAIKAAATSPLAVALVQAAESGALGRILEKGAEGAIEGALGGLPGGMASAMMNEATWKGGDPLEAILRAGMSGTASGAGMGFAMGAVMHAAKEGYGALRPAPGPGGGPTPAGPADAAPAQVADPAATPVDTSAAPGTPAPVDTSGTAGAQITEPAVTPSAPGQVTEPSAVPGEVPAAPGRATDPVTAPADAAPASGTRVTDPAVAPVEAVPASGTRVTDPVVAPAEVVPGPGAQVSDPATAAVEAPSAPGARGTDPVATPVDAAPGAVDTGPVPAERAPLGERLDLGGAPANDNAMGIPANDNAGFPPEAGQMTADGLLPPGEGPRPPELRVLEGGAGTTTADRPVGGGAERTPPGDTAHTGTDPTVRDTGGPLTPDSGPRVGTDPAPAGTDVARAGTGAAPPGTDVAPAGTDVAPAGTDVAPVGTDVAPAGTDVAKVGTDVAPAGTDVAPVGTDVAPAGTDVAPAGTDVAPVDPSAPADTAAPAEVPAERPELRTANTEAAERRIADTEAALAGATERADAARAKLAEARADLEAAEALLAEAPGNRDARQMAREAQEAVDLAQRELRPLEANEAAAQREATAVAGSEERIRTYEAEVADLVAAERAQLSQEPTPEQYRRGIRRNMEPPPNSPEGRELSRIRGELRAARAALQDSVSGLTESLKARVDAATPGEAGRAPAMENAAALGGPLEPRGGMPIDVETGQPMTTGDWATDHIMSRSEISKLPEFQRLSPAEQRFVLLEVPENFLPMTAEANGSKGNRSVADWIAARRAAGDPLPPDVVEALLAADARARAAIAEAIANPQVRRP
ncbi:DUF4157 domain-containing protein [Streptomyces sp. NPDC048340]|uniref:eCIS core domain-containing protein n=1 Tax=Streptomyces sp. NPDC048340 TaxID=3365537 RepID=UPI003718225F